MVAISRTRIIRTVFICSVLACCSCILFNIDAMVSIQRNNIYKVTKSESKKNNDIKLIARDSLKYISEGTGHPNHTDIVIKAERMKTIVVYAKHNQSMIRMLHMFVKFSKCAYSQCQVKYSGHPDVTYEADAILIQSKNIFDLPPPPRRDKDQVFVLAVRDAFPTMVHAIHADRKAAARRWLDVFNWTMTYRFDSDIVYPYSFLAKRDNGSIPKDIDHDRIYNEKDKDVIWLVSHCHTKSKREDYVKELSTVINVDIYGGCGKKFSCPKGSGGNNIEKCDIAFARRYKFILAFENTFYLDYVTEKVFHWFNLDMIIVGRGGTNYSQRFPPDTIIDAADFESAKELGYYLKTLGSDKNRYTAYLKRKSKYYSVGNRVTAQMAYCNLCEYLHTLAAHRNIYTNIANWWTQGWRNGPRVTNMTLDQFERHIAIIRNNFTGDDVSTFAKLSSANS